MCTELADHDLGCGFLLEENYNDSIESCTIDAEHRIGLYGMFCMDALMEYYHCEATRPCRDAEACKDLYAVFVEECGG